MAYIDLKIAIYNRLITSTSKTFERKVIPGTTFPYVVYNIPNNERRNESNGENNILEIDLWDNINDSTRLENLTDLVEKSFLNYGYKSSSLSINFVKDARLSIPDEDENIIRRRLRYQIISYLNKN